MKDAGLDYSCYYHIRDYHVDRDRFARFMSPKGASSMAAWWNRMPQYDGLFDYQNTVRPAYFNFLLLSRLTGDRLGAQSSDANVHAFLAYDPVYDYYSLMVWNFAAEPVRLAIEAKDLPARLTATRHRAKMSACGPYPTSRWRPVPRRRRSPWNLM